MLEIRDIFFSYDQSVVIKNISARLDKGQHLAVIGESGCGKSTLLKLIYGIHDLDSGEIYYNGELVLGPRVNLIPGHDSFKFLAQDFGLMPYITVSENVGKFLSNIHKEKKKKRIDELLELVEMKSFASIKAKNLSGGQQQRVALAMVLAKQPELLLLDEPFSQIDTFRTNNLRRSIFSYCKTNEISCIVATHDSTDVLSFADKVLVLKNGEEVASGTPKSVFERPGSKYVASLFGDVNDISSKFFNRSTPQLIYPHQLKIVSSSDLKAIVVKNYYKGNKYLIEAIYTEGNLFFENPDSIEAGLTIYLDFTP